MALEKRLDDGLYAGGNPNVWISNSYSNDGVTNAQFTYSNFDAAGTVLPGSPDSIPLTGAGRPGYDVPQELVDNVAAVSPADANDSNLALIDYVDESGRPITSRYGFFIEDLEDVARRNGMQEAKLPERIPASALSHRHSALYA